MKSNLKNVKLTLLALIMTLLTGLNSSHATGLSTDSFTYLVADDSVADCNNFYFTIWIKSATGVNFRTFQGTLFISYSFLNAPPIPVFPDINYTNVTASWVPGSSDIISDTLFGAHFVRTPQSGGSPQGTGGDTVVILLNTLHTNCPGTLITNTYVRIGQVKITRNASLGGCWGGCTHNKVGWYEGVNAGQKTQATITDWSTPCSSGINFILSPNSTSFAANLSDPTSAITANTVANPNGNNGSATVTATGGIRPYSYHWNNGQTTQTATGLVYGTYIVTVTDASNSCTTSATATLQLIPIPTLNEWGLIILSILVLGAGVFFVRGRVV